MGGRRRGPVGSRHGIVVAKEWLIDEHASGTQVSCYLPETGPCVKSCLQSCVRGCCEFSLVALSVQAPETLKPGGEAALR